MDVPLAFRTAAVGRRRRPRVRQRVEMCSFPLQGSGQASDLFPSDDGLTLHLGPYLLDFWRLAVQLKAIRLTYSTRGGTILRMSINEFGEIFLAIATPTIRRRCSCSSYRGPGCWALHHHQLYRLLELLETEAADRSSDNSANHSHFTRVGGRDFGSITVCVSGTVEAPTAGGKNRTFHT